MSDENPDVQAIFNEALEQKSAEEVAAYLDVACDLDADLRAQVEALLRAHQEAGNFLGGQPSEAVTEAPTPNNVGASDDWHGAPNPSDLTKHFSHLEVLELLGQGGMGAVYKARQPKLDRVVALKLLPPKFGRDPTFAERFVREAQALARLNHPNIVTVHDFGQSGELCFILMERGGAHRRSQRAGHRLAVSHWHRHVRAGAIAARKQHEIRAVVGVTVGKTQSARAELAPTIPT